MRETVVCSACKSTNVQRTRTLGARERFRKRFTRKRVHVCLDCGWRGWLRHAGKQKASATGPKARTIVTVLVALLVTVLLAIYLVQRFNDLTNP